MKYIGNKKRLLNFIDAVVQAEGLPKKGTFIDVFAGTTNVAQYYKKKGYKIIANDFMTYSYVFQQSYIKNNRVPTFNKLLRSRDFNIDPTSLKNKYEPLKIIIDYLNKLPGKKGFIFQNYAPSGKLKRQFFSNENAMRIDATRGQIDKWKKKELVS